MSNSVIMFFSRSADVPAGRGAGEKLGNGDDFTELNKIKNWRRILSNFHQCEFEVDGYKWRSVEHYFHANKFIGTPLYIEYTLNSGSTLSKSDGTTARKVGRSNTMSVNNWDDIKKDVLLKGQIAKFTQCPECTLVLKLTGNAILTHKMSRMSPVITEYGLMNIRDKLKKE
jgi:ribA/ribD-fused uncharacterized protein